MRANILAMERFEEIMIMQKKCWCLSEEMKSIVVSIYILHSLLALWLDEGKISNDLDGVPYVEVSIDICLCLEVSFRIASELSHNCWQYV